MSEESLQNEAENVENNLVENINDEDEEILEDGEIDDDSSSDEKVANLSIESKSVGDYSVFDNTERNPLYADLDLIKKHNRRKHKKKRSEGISGDEKKSKHRKRKHDDYSDQHSTSPSQKKKKKKKKHNRTKKHRDSSSSSDISSVKHPNTDEKKSHKYSKRKIPNEDYNFKDHENNNFSRDSFNKEENESSTSDSCYSDFENHVKQFQNYTPINTSDKKDTSTKSNLSEEDEDSFYGYDSNQNRGIRSPNKFSDRIPRRGISRKSPNKNEFTQVCRFFREGNCNKADKCTFLHQIPPEDSRKNELCSKYLTGKCNGENDCNYLHSDFPCQSFFLNSVCYNEPNCLFSHEPLTESTGMLIRKWKDQLKGIKYTHHLSNSPRPVRGLGLLPTPTMDELLNGGKHVSPKIGPGPSNMPILSGPGIKSLMELAVEPSQTLQEKIETNSVICLKPDQEANDEDETSITAAETEDSSYTGYQGSRSSFMNQPYINPNEISHNNSWQNTEYDHMSWNQSQNSGMDMTGEVDPFTIEATDVSYTPRDDLVNGNVATKRQILGETEDEPNRKLIKSDFSNLESTNDNVFANHVSKSIWMPPENSYYAAKSLSSPSPAQKIMDLVSKKAESSESTKNDESFFSKLSFDQTTSSAQTGVSSSSKTLENNEEVQNGYSPSVKRVSRSYTPVQPIRRQLSVSELNKEPLIIPLHDKQPEELRSDPRISEGRLYLLPLSIFTAKLPQYSFDEVPSTPNDFNKINRPDPRLSNVQKADPRVKARPNDPRLRNRANTAGSVDRMGTTSTNGLHSSENFSKDTKPYIPKTPAALLRRPSPIPSLPELIIKDSKPKQEVKSSIPPPLVRKKKSAVYTNRSTSLSSLPVSSSFNSTDERPSELPIYDPRYVPSSLPPTSRADEPEEPLTTPTPEPPPVLTSSVTPPTLEHKNKQPQTCDGPPKLFDIRGSKTSVVSSMPKLTRAPPKLKRAPVLKKSG